jgi:hypothetical protein
MYHTTGFANDEIIDLCALVYANEENCDIDPWPPSLGLYKSVVIALTYMRRNRVQQELAETYETSQPTISRANSRITSRLAVVLAPFVPAAEDLDPNTHTSTTARCFPAGRGASTGSCIWASTKPPVRTSRSRAIFTESSRGYPTRLTEAATMHIASTNHQCLTGFPAKVRSAIKGTSARG